MIIIDNAIYVLWARQLKRFVRSPPRIIGTLATPFLFLLALGFGFGPVFAKAGEGNYLQFLVPGIIAMSILFSSIVSGIEIIWDKQFGFLKETLVAPVSRLNIMIGRTLGGATVSFCQGLLVLLISFLLGFKFVSWSMLPVALVFMLLIALAFTALGTAIASVLADMQGFQLIMNLLIMPIFFLSGAIFPLQGVPKAITIIAMINPMTYGVDGIRSSLTNIAGMSIITSLIVMLSFTTVFVVIGSLLFRKIQI
ncbi:MAG: ABC transporter permease [archaeon]